MNFLSNHSPFTITATICAALAATILIAFLVMRPAITNVVKGWLLLGFGVFPIAAALSTNVQGYQTTQKRAFCGSCHVMEPHAGPSNDPKGWGLAAAHARNSAFGNENCYQCHADYGMYGTALTKIGGMRHVWLYYTKFRSMAPEEAAKEVVLRHPFPNQNCMHCHSTNAPQWNKIPDHRSTVADVRADKISCAGSGCHGYAHPQTKADAKRPSDETSPPRVDSDAGAAR